MKFFTFFLHPIVNSIQQPTTTALSSDRCIQTSYWHYLIYNTPPSSLFSGAPNPHLLPSLSTSVGPQDFYLTYLKNLSKQEADQNDKPEYDYYFCQLFFNIYILHAWKDVQKVTY